MQQPALYVVLAFTAAAVVGAWGYFGRYQLSRPPLGVASLGDIAVMIAATVAVPYLYLVLPLPLLSGLFALGVLCVLYGLAEPVLRARWAILMVALLLPAADIAAAARSGARGPTFLLINDGVLTLVVVGVANLWAGSGAKARDIAVLAGALAGYDVIATSWLPLTADLYHHLAVMPLIPELAWGAGRDRLGIGLGDVLLAATFPLVMRKAFGRTAGILSAVLAMAGIAALAVGVMALSVRVALPVMALLGPLAAAQYLFWRRQGAERTTREYLEAE